jgi:hypothetical protein
MYLPGKVRIRNGSFSELPQIKYDEPVTPFERLKASRTRSVGVASDAEVEYIRRKIALIKVPFVYGEQGVHAELG